MGNTSHKNSRNAWGYVFEWTENHQTPEEYHHLKYTYDTLGEECVAILKELSPPQKEEEENKRQQKKPENLSSMMDEKSLTGTPAVAVAASAPSRPRARRDLYVLLRDHHQEHEKLQQLWAEVNNVPAWVDWDQIARGQDVFYRYGMAILTGLTFQSLLGGTGSSRVSEVLARTGGFSEKVVRSRLLETTQHILECTDSLESIQPGGVGWVSSLRVRLLHCMVRQRILQLTASRPAYYSVEENGIPINDFDSMGTIAVFSATIIWQSLPRQGIYLRPQEIQDYIALWRLVAHYMGTPTDFFATPAQAKAFMETLYLYEYTPSSTSKLHARNIIRAFENTPPHYASRTYLEAYTHWLNGHQLADALGIGRPPAYYWAMIAGQFMLYKAICYTCRMFPSLDRRQIVSLRKSIWSIVHSEKWGLGSLSTFDFKYRPAYGNSTKDEGDVKERKSLVFWTADRQSMFILLLVTFLCGLTMWTLVKIIVLGLSDTASSAL